MTDEEKRARHAAYMRKWRAAHPENAEYQRLYHQRYLADPIRREDSRRQAREWNKENKEYVKERNRARRERIRDELLARERAYYVANRARIREVAKQWYANHKDRYRSYVEAYRADPDVRQSARDRALQWRLDNPDRFKDNRREAKARRRITESSARLARVDYKAVRERSDGRCGICREPLGDLVHYDHIIPLSRGGEHSTQNLQLAHPLCNLRKGNQTAT